VAGDSAAVGTALMSESDAQLIASTAKSDRSAFARLYDRHAGRLFGWLTQVVGQPATAEEVLQETFLQVWETAGSYKEALASPSTWIFLIARSRAYDSIRRSRRQPEFADLDQLWTTARPDDDAVTNERRTRVNRALSSLPEDLRRPITLAFFGGQTYETVAASLKIPVGTAKTRIRQGIIRLRRLMLNDEAESQ
jgi:RNA polymerase sigma-70 factor, ECF subfamily